MPEEPIVLRNRNRYKSFAFTIYHAIACQDGKCYCGKQAKMGRDERGEFNRAEQSVFIPPRGQSKPLPRAVLKIPQVKCALAEPNFIELVGVLTEVQVIAAPVVKQSAALPSSLLPPPLPLPPLAAPPPKATAPSAPTFTAVPSYRAATAQVPSSKRGPRGR